MPDLRLHEVRGKFRRDREKGAVTDHRQLLNFPMMVPNEADVSDQGGEVFPAGKRLGVEQ